jgi:hypothetical protein
LPIRRDEVLRLQIAVREPFVVRGDETTGDLQCVVDRLPHRDWAAAQSFAQRFAVEQLHHRVGDRAGRTEIVNREDVRVRKNGDSLSLTLEAREPLRIICE